MLKTSVPLNQEQSKDATSMWLGVLVSDTDDIIVSKNNSKLLMK